MSEHLRPRRPGLESDGLHKRYVDDLHKKHPDLTRDEIEALYRENKQALSSGAKTHDFIPVIAHKKTHEHLKKHKKKLE